VGKSTSPLPTNANVLFTTFRYFRPYYDVSVSLLPPPYYDISMLPAGRERKVAGRVLALVDSGDVNLPTPQVLDFADKPWQIQTL
jgi:hypothetical protein